MRKTSFIKLIDIAAKTGILPGQLVSTPSVDETRYIEILEDYFERLEKLKFNKRAKKIRRIKWALLITFTVMVAAAVIGILFPPLLPVVLATIAAGGVALIPLTALISPGINSTKPKNKQIIEGNRKVNRKEAVANNIAEEINLNRKDINDKKKFKKHTEFAINLITSKIKGLEEEKSIFAKKDKEKKIEELKKKQENLNSLKEKIIANIKELDTNLKIKKAKLILVTYEIDDLKKIQPTLDKEKNRWLKWHCPALMSEKSRILTHTMAREFSYEDLKDKVAKYNVAKQQQLQQLGSSTNKKYKQKEALQKPEYQRQRRQNRLG